MRHVIREITRQASAAKETPTTYLLNNFSEPELNDFISVIQQVLEMRRQEPGADSSAYDYPPAHAESKQLSDEEADSLMAWIYIELSESISQLETCQNTIWGRATA
ncbi:MAG: hypothetical protein JSW28_09350 [Thermoplasmata archaeon]|nr:MAG: hypothetical protein JSW28_09350 [Thermoplasmata archaeon]